MASISKRKEMSPLQEKEEKKIKTATRNDNRKEEFEELKRGGNLEEKINMILDVIKENHLEKNNINVKLDKLCEMMVQEREERRVEMEEMKIEMTVLKENLLKCQEKMEDLENRERRTNLVFKGVEEQKEETWKETEKIISRVIEEKFQIIPNGIARAHRLGRYNQTSKYPRMIIVKFERLAERQAILKNKAKLKNSNIFIDEDFSPQVRRERKILLKKAMEERNAGKKVFIRYKSIIVNGEEFAWSEKNQRIETLSKNWSTRNAKIFK